ncbi:MAG: DNA integrity scanning protein DisA nucleotide-binding domain protein [Planctomycetes bacterium]|nr:DNA integrity scanning protein DisA nucleotide-binding domain protein [Planctomycetota bacterium]
MKPQLMVILNTAMQVAKETAADAVLLLAEKPLDWEQVRAALDGRHLLVAIDKRDLEPPVEQNGIRFIPLDEGTVPIQERLAQALIEAVADDYLHPGSRVVAIYSGFDADALDSISLINLRERLDRLTGRDLQQLETQVPLSVLRSVVDLAVEIAREGREGKPVGTLFVVGDTRKVLTLSHPIGMDPVRGYKRKDRNIRDLRVREDIKEFAQTDGAILIEADGSVAAARRYLDAPAEGLTLAKGLGARHWAAAAISKATRAIAIVVSESTGNVRIFQKGQGVLRIPPTRRALKWQEFEFEPPAVQERP